jgi:hypothetical protein
VRGGALRMLLQQCAEPRGLAAASCAGSSAGRRSPTRVYRSGGGFGTDLGKTDVFDPKFKPAVLNDFSIKSAVQKRIL